MSSFFRILENEETVIQLVALCNISSYNTTQSELAEVVTRINETLRNNRLHGVNVIDGSVLVAGLKTCNCLCALTCYTL